MPDQPNQGQGQHETSKKKNNSPADKDVTATATTSSNKPYQSNFWTKYIEKQKSLKAAADAASNKTAHNNDPIKKESNTSSSTPLRDELDQLIKAREQESKDGKISEESQKRTIAILEKKRKDLLNKLASTSDMLRLLMKINKRIQRRDDNHFTYIGHVGNRDTGSMKYYGCCILMKQCILGAIGGIAVGFQTKFLSPYRFSPPATPIPPRWNLPLTRKTGELFIKSSSVLWRMCKRGLITGLIFDQVDWKIEQYRNRRDWKNTAIAGGICGSLFGIRGGFYGPLHSAISFFIIGAIGGYFFINKPGDADKYNGGGKINKIETKPEQDY